MAQPTNPGALQVLLACGPSPLVAGLPPILRTAQRAAEELKPARIVFAADEGFSKRWARQLQSFEGIQIVCANGERPEAYIDARAPLLIVSGAGIPAPEALSCFMSEAARANRPASWMSGGRALAVYHPSAQTLLGEATAAAAANRALSGGSSPFEVTAGSWHASSEPDFVEQAERAFYKSLGKASDGYIARFDRRVSTFVSSLLLKTPVTPNHITTASLLVGLLGCWWLASGVYAWQALGALLLWSCCILDGCDGEVARLKLLCSPSGATYDVAADNIAHLATFAAVVVGVQRSNPETTFLVPGLLLLSGVTACMYSVWWLILRRPDEKRTATELLIERVASRDYIYLVVGLVLVGKLHWFMWTAGLGSHVFNGALWWSARAKASPSS